VSTWDAKVSRVDQPEPGLLSLSFRASGRNEVLLLVTLPGTMELGVVEKRPRGATASPSTTKLRRHIEGARIEEVARSRRAIRVSLTRGGSRQFLVAAPSKPYGAWWLCEADGSLVVRSPAAPGEAPAENEHLVAESIDALRARGPSALAAHEEARKAQLERALRRHIKRLVKKRDAITADLERSKKAEELHEKASLLLAHSSEIPANSTDFEVPSWQDPERSVRIALDPKKTPAELAQDLYAKAKRLKRGLDVAPARLAAVEAELQALRGIETDAAGQSNEELESTLSGHGVTIVEPRERERKRRQAGARLPYRAFSTEDDATVLVGRGAADNDRLTLRVARPHDLWLHARGVTGAHVVVPLAKGKSCSSDTLVDAATLAAHFSDLRGEPVVDVLYTPRRFVRKRKGSPVGSVTLEREKVIAVRVEPARLDRLLGTEKKPS
jgi:predicted ribosome quality control (RQC) complex YloA/Tae2 family protein